MLYSRQSKRIITTQAESLSYFMTNLTTPQRRGRPRKTSREKIIQAALTLLNKDENTPLSINGLARFMGIAPMGLYSYFENIDDLRQSVGEQILGDLHPDIPTDHCWQQQFKSWANSIRLFFLDRPYALSLVGYKQRIAYNWLRQVATLTRILQKTTLTDDKLAHAVAWSSKTIVAAISMEISEQQVGNKLNNTDINQLSSEDAALLSQYTPFWQNSMHDAEFEYSLQRCIDALEQVI